MVLKVLYMTLIVKYLVNLISLDYESRDNKEN